MVYTGKTHVASCGHINATGLREAVTQLCGASTAVAVTVAIWAAVPSRARAITARYAAGSVPTVLLNRLLLLRLRRRLLLRRRSNRLGFYILLKRNLCGSLH